jgi:DNA mismatch endonuclease (patch repair protein)
MADVFNRKKRSEIMRAVRSTDTTPELVVRRLVYGLGFRYRLHVRSITGSPDLVFRSRRKVIFVHGCFWHRHSCADGRSTPASHRDYWMAKFSRNRDRDVKVRRNLRLAGWKILVIWECHTKNPKRLKPKLKSFIDAHI